MCDIKTEIVKLLRKLDEDIIFALARNITQDLMKSNTVEEALENIIKCSEDAISILRKKNVTKEILFNYLIENNIRVRQPTTKNDLIDKILEIWGTSGKWIQNNEVTTSRNNNLTNESKPQEKEDNNLLELGIQFTKWFYSMLNVNSCGSEHFFPDVKFHLNIHPNNENITTENNADEIINILTRIHMQYELYFNLNESSNGIQTRMDEHGLVLIMACGSLHRHQICVGVFEQIFALARDPFAENNWKIKKTEMNLRLQRLSEIQTFSGNAIESNR